MDRVENRAVVAALALSIASTLVAAAAGALTLDALAVIALGIGGLWLLGTRVGRARVADTSSSRSSRTTSLRRVELLPPPERYRHRSPSSQQALHQALLNARLGSVAVQAGALLITGEGTCRITFARSEGVGLADLRVEATSDDFALAVCDTLAVTMGPFTLHVDGLSLFVDGTTPLIELQRQLYDLRMTVSTSSSGSARVSYLN